MPKVKTTQKRTSLSDTTDPRSFEEEGIERDGHFFGGKGWGEMLGQGKGLGAHLVELDFGLLNYYKQMLIQYL